MARIKPEYTLSQPKNECLLQMRTPKCPMIASKWSKLKLKPRKLVNGCSVENARFLSGFICISLLYRDYRLIFRCNIFAILWHWCDERKKKQPDDKTTHPKKCLLHSIKDWKMAFAHTKKRKKYTQLIHKKATLHGWIILSCLKSISLVYRLLMFARRTTKMEIERNGQRDGIQRFNV